MSETIICEHCNKEMIWCDCDKKKYTLKDIEKAITRYRERHTKELGHLVWSNTHVSLFMLAAFLLGFIAGAIII